MSGLANVAHQLGAEVTGSDAKDSLFARSLRNAGLRVTIGHTEENVPSGATVVYSSAVRPDNAERLAAKRLHLAELHRSALLAELTRQRTTFAVCGAHGKTTTSALLAHVLTECGLAPSYVIGGLPNPPMAHSKAGTGDLLVIEADESDRSLLQYNVDTLLVTNIDLDHVRDGGYQTVQDVAEVIAKLAHRSRVTLASEETAVYLQGVSACELVSPRPDGDGSTFQLERDRYAAPTPGLHQIQNAALAITAARRAGCGADSIARALRTFPGLARRYNLMGRLPSGAEVIDDYAHHPTEVQAVIAAARKGCRGRVLVVFQPHLFSRTARFAHEFAQALRLADLSYVEDIYPSREKQEDWPDVSSALILEDPTLGATDHVQAALARSEMASHLASITTNRDRVLILGAGDIADLAHLVARF